MSNKNRNRSGATQVNEPKTVTPESTESKVLPETTAVDAVENETVVIEAAGESEVITVDGTDEATDAVIVSADESDEAPTASPIDSINENLTALQVGSTEPASDSITVQSSTEESSTSAIPADPVAVNVDPRPLHIKLIEQWLIGDSPADQAYVVAMAPGRTMTDSIKFNNQMQLITTIRYILGLKGQDFFEAMDRWLEIVDEYSDGAFGPKYAMRGLEDKNAPFTAESAALLQRFLYLSQRIANKESRGFVLKQCIDTTVALNKLMDPEAREKLNAWLAQYDN